MLSQVRNALKEKSLMPECDVVEQNKVLMNLAHISHVRNDPQTELSRH